MEKIYSNLRLAINDVRAKFIENAYIVRTEKWQGIPLEHDMKEILNTSFTAKISSDIDMLQLEIKPNLPWADLHFEERVGGIPTNPGETYKLWPFYKMDDKMRTVGEQFTHTYMERIWPKTANKYKAISLIPHNGIRYPYGDLTDMMELLYREPFTRQAYLPIWFPEDTGANHGGRLPCTLGYHFIMRDGYLNVVYYIRSCDFLRHFRDDIYLTSRKVLYIIDTLKRWDKARGTNKWLNIKPGTITMHITSLHCFNNEFWTIEKQHKNENKNI